MPEGLLIKIPNWKGDLGLCSNYRGIILLSVTRESTEHSHLTKAEITNRSMQPGPANGQVMYLLDHKTTNYSKTVN